MSLIRAGFIAVLASLLAGNALAASVSGQITDDGGAGIPMEVILFVDGPKGWSIAYTVTADAAGNYTVAAVTPAGYRVFSRMPDGFDGNYADRWYDQAAPNSSGWISDDADVVLVADAGSAVSGIDITLPLQGGLDGRVINGSGTQLAGMVVRAEWQSDARYHHDDFSQGNEHPGDFFMRGLVEDSYRVIVYDAGGVYATTVFNGPYAVTAGSVAAIADLTINTEATDPYEPNNGPGQAGAMSVDGVGLHAVPSVPWTTSGARVGPRGSDVDWFCLDALAGDHFNLITTTWLDVGGTPRPHPWTDPIVSLWTGDGATLVDWSDDVDRLNPELEVWITNDGPHCVVISTYGDTGWNGVQQISSGHYELTVTMLNRRPTLLVSEGGAPAPAPPAVLVRAESEVLVLDLGYGDPDLDTLTVTADHLDSATAVVNDAILDAPATGVGTWTWPISSVAAAGSPYTLDITVDDGEFAVTMPVIIVVTANNIPPTTPPPITPIPDEVVTTGIVDLVVGESIDGDGDPITIEFEVSYFDTLGAPDQSGSIAQTVAPTTFTTAPIPEDTEVFWRARAFDGQVENPYSPWTLWQRFHVDVGNDPPPAPDIYKPAEGSLLLSRRPTLSVNNVVDPDGDTPSYTFQLASDSAFTDVLTTSPVVPSSTAPTTMWAADVALDWDTTYFARASANDGRGGDSGFGEVVGFRTKPNILPTIPSYVDPDPFTCGDLVYRAAAPTEVAVAGVIDPEDSPVTIEVAITTPNEANDDPENAVLLASGSALQDLALLPTSVSLDAGSLVDNNPYAFIARARDDVGVTSYTTCMFWLDVTNSPPSETIITGPENGKELGLEGDSESVLVEVVPGSDPEVAFGVPGAWITVAYCIGEGPSVECEGAPSTWNRLDPSEVSVGYAEIWVEPVAPGEQWSVRACTLDERDACGPEVVTTFSIEDPSSGDPPGGCNCASTPKTGGVIWLALAMLLALGRRWRRSRG